MRRFPLTLAALVCLVTGGCGVYTLNPKGKSTIKAIAIERFENKSAEYGLADQMTEVVIDAFFADGTMDVVSVDNADAVLLGVLKSYERKPHQYDENDQVSSYEVRMVFDITLRDPAKNTDVWQETMSQIGVYQVADETEQDGQQRAIKLLVDGIINKTTHSW
jgi:hypothetical protein